MTTFNQYFFAKLVELNQLKQLIMKSILFILSIIFFVSCSNPLNNAYKKDNVEEDLVTIKEKISEEDFDLLSGYIALGELAEESFLGKTYADILSDAKKLKAELEAQEAEEKKLAEEAEKLEAERIARLKKSLTVSLYGKDFSEGDWQDYLTFKFAFENKTEKDIRAFTGDVVINDLFDKKIYTISLTYDDGVPAVDKKMWSGQIDYNEFMDEHVTLKNKDIEDLKVIWKPEKIIFADGSTIE